MPSKTILIIAGAAAAALYLLSRKRAANVELTIGPVQFSNPVDSGSSSRST